VFSCADDRTHIIIGRKIYESLERLLSGHTTVIVTRNKAYKIEGTLTANSLDAVLLLYKHDE